jgi:hypothetical protein
MGYVTGLRGVKQNLAALYVGERAAVKNAMGEIASLLKTYAQNNHPWMPQTGNTDASTAAAIVKADIDEIVVALSAGMDYDVFLELARNGAWSWLWPTMLACKERIMAILIKYGAVGAMTMTAAAMSGAE